MFFSSHPILRPPVTIPPRPHEFPLGEFEISKTFQWWPNFGRDPQAYHVTFQHGWVLDWNMDG
jgi:hypothetical protein